MQKTLNRMIQCAECGCISFPDATICPKCGAKYIKKLEDSDCIDIMGADYDPSISRFDNVNELSWWSHYNFTCPIHGNINIKATVISRSIKCPFCHS